MRTILESEKISLTECKRILNVNGSNYTDEEIIKIRNWMYHFAELTLDYANEKTKEELKEIENKLKTKTNEDN